MQGINYRINSLRNTVKWILIFSSLLFLPFLSCATEKESSFLELIIFESSTCEHCQKVKKEYFSKLPKKYDFLQITYYDLNYPENYQLLLDLQLEISSGESIPANFDIPVVVVDKKILYGEEEIKEKLENIIEKANNQEEISRDSEKKPMEKRTSEMPFSDKIINLAFFYQPGCRECNAIEYALSYLKHKYPTLRVEYFNLGEKKNRIIQEALGEIYNVPVDKRHLFPSIYLGDSYFIQEIDIKHLEEVIRSYQDTGSEKKWSGIEEKVKKIGEGEKTKTYLQKLKIPAVAMAGLIDGINPCAFSIVIFLITYLSYLKKKKKEILQIGFSFIAAIFISYFLIGMGLFEFLQKVQFFPSIRKIIFLTGVVFTALLGAISLGDYFRIKRSNPENMILKIPSKLRRMVNTFIGKKIREKKVLIPISLGIGFLVSSVEFICTGQIYLPTIIFLSGIVSVRGAILLPLSIYNIFFIVPLMGVFLAVYFGISSGLIEKIISKNFPLSKVLTSVLFFALAAVLLYLM